MLRTAPTRILAAAATSVALCLSAPAVHAVVAANQPITRDTFVNVAQKVSPAVVNIKIKSNAVFGNRPTRVQIPPGYGLDDEMRKMLERLFEQEMQDFGSADPGSRAYDRSASGVLIRPDGYIVTSNHVIAGIPANDIEVSLPDGRSFDKVQVVGQDDLTDLAVLKIDGDNLPHAVWGDSEALRVGDLVVAIGNPLEFNNTVSEGIVSAKHRVIRKAPLEDLLQTTAMINPGNSGGALVNLDGELIGINMAIATSTGLWSGLGFAIPSKTARHITEQVIASGKVARGYLGIEMERMTVGYARQLNFVGESGIIVKNVRPGSAAEQAGLQRYDVITRVNGQDVKDIYDMHGNIGARNAGETVTLEIFRDEGKPELTRKELMVSLGERPTQQELERQRPEPELPGEPASPTDALLGLEVSPAEGGKGLKVDSVSAGSPADGAGVRTGDVIFQVNKKDVNSVQDMQQALRNHRDDWHLFYIERDGASVFAQIKAK